MTTGHNLPITAGMKRLSVVLIAPACVVLAGCGSSGPTTPALTRTQAVQAQQQAVLNTTQEIGQAVNSIGKQVPSSQLLAAAQANVKPGQEVVAATSTATGWNLCISNPTYGVAARVTSQGHTIINSSNNGLKDAAAIRAFCTQALPQLPDHPGKPEHSVIPSHKPRR